MKAKKLLFLPMLLISMVFFVQCTEDPYYSDSDDPATQSALKAGKGGGGGGHTETAGNNLSFPAIAVDGFSISPLAEATFTTEYIGPYSGLTPDEIAYLEAYGPWYAQKTEGNSWQAENKQVSNVGVTYVDWGDNIESVNPKVRRPFRLEVTLYKDVSSDQMAGYTMALLANPSSKDEVQGTNAVLYNSDYATIVSNQPRLIVQYLADLNNEDLFWDESDYRWKAAPNGEDPPILPQVIPVTFTPELNVGGKYIFGASLGGWKPAQTGNYRITFYVPSGSGVSLSGAIIGNIGTEIILTRGFSPLAESDEGGAATPVVVGEKNLTYVDVLVVGGGGKR